MAGIQGRRMTDGRRAPNGVAEGAVAYTVTVGGEEFVRFLERPSDWEAMRDAGTPYHLVIDDTTGLPSWDTMPAGGGGSLVDGDYGDIVVSGGGTVMQIDADTVGPAELQDTAVTPGEYTN